jgi:hypothetical protein
MGRFRLDVPAGNASVGDNLRMVVSPGLCGLGNAHSDKSVNDFANGLAALQSLHRNGFLERRGRIALLRNPLISEVPDCYG